MKPFSRRIKRVRRAFVPDNLIDICERQMCDFHTFGDELVEFTNGEFYVYQDNGTKILGVAHLDTVQPVSTCDIITTKTGAKVVISPALDDRLGVWVIVDVLPRLGIEVDWLLTTGEESANSTGEDFVKAHLAKSGKQYNWIFQFDRHGTDVVMYDYDTSTLRDRLKSVGMSPGIGSFSDICSMEGLGCAGFNVGVGYEDNHSKRAFAWLDDTFAQVARFMDFYERYKDKFMQHESYVYVWEWRDYTTKEGMTHSYRTKVRKSASLVLPGDEVADSYYAPYKPSYKLNGSGTYMLGGMGSSSWDSWDSMAETETRAALTSSDMNYLSEREKKLIREENSWGSAPKGKKTPKGKGSRPRQRYEDAVADIEAVEMAREEEADTELFAMLYPAFYATEPTDVEINRMESEGGPVFDPLDSAQA